jgi:hypothetical protein
MKRVMYAIGLTAMTLMAAPALAQTTGASAPSANAPSVNLVYAGGFLGVGAVQNTASIAGGELGVRVFHNLDVFVEGGYDKDGVPRRRVDLTNTLVPILTKASGKTATASITAPVKFGLGGLRYVFDVTNDFHAYVLAEGGKASIEYKPRYFVNGTDVTDSLATYGITLGSDLVSTEAVPAYGGGFGFWYTKGYVYVDASLRLLSLQTASQSTNLTRAHIGLGLRF